MKAIYAALACAMCAMCVGCGSRAYYFAESDPTKPYDKSAPLAINIGDKPTLQDKKFARMLSELLAQKGFKVLGFKWARDSIEGENIEGENIASSDENIARDLNKGEFKGDAHENKTVIQSVNSTNCDINFSSKIFYDTQTGSYIRYEIDYIFFPPIHSIHPPRAHIPARFMPHRVPRSGIYAHTMRMKNIELGLYCDNEEVWAGAVQVSAREFERNARHVISNLIDLIGAEFSGYLYIDDAHVYKNAQIREGGFGVEGGFEGENGFEF